MEKLNKLEPLIEKILVTNAAARKDDFILILCVMRHYGVTDKPLDYVLTHHKELKLPSFASIIRVRRKLQAQDANLCDADAIAIREAAIGDYKQYALDI